MTFLRQGQTYTIEVPSKQRKSHEYQPVNDNNITKKYLTNSQKSMFCLKWESGGVAEQYYQRSRSKSKSQHHLNIEKHSPWKDSSTLRYHEQQSGLNSKPKHIEKPKITHQTSSVPKAYRYPYAYPPMSVDVQIVPEKSGKRQNTHRTITIAKSRIKQSDRSINLVRDTNKLKIEHHYVDSPAEAQRLIEDLQRKGFVETGIHTPAMYSDKH
ncbi:unnamed protein product [Rotaria sp. Silwood1]|nr:unnamed protein product [Rotaria sp. Silwood1]CAF3488745.1 unnamed protein product [Rotaria sp. Silwood1]CAF3544206.1 unnamed protein product [Rotaria sp. Silwood1]CAF4639570.1 unnamed protein product [Rotaria sp. Silwood1]CAF4728545.1 unnamed protein product [Rotaria sp. Silwood1]